VLPSDTKTKECSGFHQLRARWPLTRRSKVSRGLESESGGRGVKAMFMRDASASNLEVETARRAVARRSRLLRTSHMSELWPERGAMPRALVLALVARDATSQLQKPTYQLPGTPRRALVQLSRAKQTGLKIRFPKFEPVNLQNRYWPAPEFGRRTRNGRRYDRFA
jgi:hypothetical protein